jgi:hypothetical protein
MEEFLYNIVILVIDYTCNNFNFGQFYFLIVYVGKHRNGPMIVLVTETCSRWVL